MTISANSYFSNSIVGIPKIGAGIDIHRVDTVPKYAVGFGFTRADGAKFRYGYIGASDTNRGLLVAPEDVGATQVDIDAAVWTPSTATAPGGEEIAPGNAGSHYVQLTLASISADQFAGGHLVITDDDGEGYTYRVRGNTATDNPVSGAVLLELYEPIVTSLSTDTDVAIVACRYNNLVAHALGGGTGSNACVGVTCAGMSTTNYGWIQTKGVCAALAGGAVPVQGQLVQASSDVAGAVCAYTSVSSTAVTMNSYTNIVGYCIDPGDSTGHSVIQLMLE